MILRNWSVFLHNRNEYQAPELGSPRLQGEVYGNIKFKNGTFINTSAIVSIEDIGDYKVARTRSGSRYILYKEDILKECLEKYPDYYEKLSIR